MKKYMSLAMLLAVILMVMLSLTGCLLSKKVYEHWEFDYAVEEIQTIKIVEKTQEFNKPPYKVVKELDSSKINEICDDIKELTMYSFALPIGSPMEPFGTCVWIIYNSGEYDLISLAGSSKYRYDSETGELLGQTSWLYSIETEFEAILNKYLNA